MDPPQKSLDESQQPPPAYYGAPVHYGQRQLPPAAHQPPPGGQQHLSPPSSTSYPQAHPVAMPAPVVGEVVAPADPPRKLDCIMCESMNLDHRGVMIRFPSHARLGERCEECQKVIGGSAPFNQCMGPNGDDGCGRQVCAACADLSRTERQHSRWNHRDRTWKTTLFGCKDGHGCLTFTTMLCYYHPMFGVSATDIHFEPQENPDKCKSGIMGFLGMFFISHIMFFDFFCFSVCTLQKSQVVLRQRFGLEPRPCTEVFFCRWCVAARLKREAAMRGYLQPYVCCGPTMEEAEQAVPPPQPGVPRRPQGSGQYPQPAGAPHGMY